MIAPSHILSADFWKGDSCHFAGDALPEIVTPHVEGGCVIFQTSGSTGVPKRFVLSKPALLASARAVNRALAVNQDSIWGLALPAGHVGGFGVIVRAYAAECGFAEFQSRWNVESYLDWLRHVEVTHSSLVPTQMYDLISAQKKAPTGLRAVVVGGGRLCPDAGQAARDLGWPVLASFGMTEACSQIATQSLDSLTLPFSAAPMEVLPIWQVKVDSEQRLHIRGEALFAGVIQNGEFLRRSGDWLKTQDRVEIHNRTLAPLGRSDSMVKVMGELIDLEQIERRLIELSLGRFSPNQLAVISIPDARRENALIALFESEQKGIEEVIARYEAQASGPERLQTWRCQERFPRSQLGKIRKVELRDAWIRAISAELS